MPRPTPPPTLPRDQILTAPRTLQGRIGWLTARALNVPRRPLVIGLAAAVVFIGALAGLMAIPNRAARAARILAPQPHERPDTMALLAARERAQRGVRGVEDALGSARALIERWQALPPPTLDTLSTADQLRRDSLQRVASSLAQLRERVETAPLLASYRALAESPELRGRPRVRVLLDSLTEIERAREQVGVVGGVDPVFVALTERAGEIGREIRGIAEARLGALSAEIERLRPPPAPDPLPPPRVDTLGLLARLDTARADLESADQTIEWARERHRQLDERAARARAISSIGASPFAIFTAALVLGVGFAFGVAFIVELRSPRVGTARELEWIAGAPLLGTVRDVSDEPERARRRADRLLAPLLRPEGEFFRQVYARMADRAYDLAPTCVVSDDPAIAAAVAANVGAVSARSARSTLLIDADHDHPAAAAAFGIDSTPGLMELLQRRVHWTSIISQVTVGRDRTMDVMPAGGPPEAGHDLREPFSGEVEHFRRRYDTLLVSAPATDDGAIPPFAAMLPQALVCARAGYTPVRTLVHMLTDLRRQGVVVRGVLLWDSEVPEIEAPAVHRERPAATVAG